MNLKKYINTLLALIGIVIVFHICILFKIIPYDIAWGGRLQSDSEMFVFEGISIGINFFIVLVLLMKARYVKFRFGRRTINIILWVLLVLFILNTVGNLFAKTSFEKVFSFVTLLFSFLIWKILRANETDDLDTNPRVTGIID